MTLVFPEARRQTWELPPKEAIRLQTDLAARIVTAGRPGRVETVAGIDVGVRQGLARAAVAVLTFPGLALLTWKTAEQPAAFPYVPGLLTFREGPVIVDALEQLDTAPDLLIFDGQGIAHPRRMGIAAHMGLLTGIPSIGCAKSRLCGQHDEPGRDKGSAAPLLDRGETIGTVLRTRNGVKPVYVSPGHRIGLESAVEYVLACCTRFRLPETTRQAHRIAGGFQPRMP